MIAVGVESNCMHFIGREREGVKRMSFSTMNNCIIVVTVVVPRVCVCLFVVFFRHVHLDPDVRVHRGTENSYILVNATALGLAYPAARQMAYTYYSVGISDLKPLTSMSADQLPHRKSRPLATD